MAQIKVDNLQKAFGDFVAVKGSTFTVEDGEFFVMLGPSGCGKTTTLRMIAGLELPTSGEILLGGEDVTFKRAAQRDIAFVFQLFALYPHMNVRANIGFPLKCQGMPKAEIKQRVEEAARILRITDLLDRRVSGLSGGDRQRVALGRAIVRQPMAFMMDEPLGGGGGRGPRGRPPPPPADVLHDGRAAGGARCRVPPPHVRRAARPPRPTE